MNSTTTLSRPTLAVAMIVKNEAKVLQQCLDSIAGLADEIVILDSGSTDETEAIARHYTDKFYINHEWPGFGRQRQIAQSHVVSDWILWLDADEVVTPTLAQSIREVITKNKNNTVYKLDRLNWYFGRFVRYGSASPDFVTRLYPTMLTGYNDKLVHESVIIPEGSQQAKLKGHLLHYTFNSYYEHLKKSIAYSEAWAEQRAQAGETSTLTKAVLKSLGRVMRDYILRRGFLDGSAGIAVTVLSMQSVYNKYAMLYYKSKEKKNNENPSN